MELGGYFFLFCSIYFYGEAAYVDGFMVLREAFSGLSNKGVFVPFKCPAGDFVSFGYEGQVVAYEYYPA
jgi:hypothetical protein